VIKYIATLSGCIKNSCAVADHHSCMIESISRIENIAIWPPTPSVIARKCSNRDPAAGGILDRFECTKNVLKFSEMVGSIVMDTMEGVVIIQSDGQYHFCGLEQDLEKKWHLDARYDRQTRNSNRIYSCLASSLNTKGVFLPPL